MSRGQPGFDGAAAVTRSLLGYGVLAGVFYLVVGLILALTRDGFDLTRHPLSALMLGEGGWMQRANLILTGLMVLAAALGIRRAMAGSESGRLTSPLVALYGVSLMVAAVFPPDPVAGFPPGSTEGDLTTSGILHLAAGAVGFISLACAALAMARWFNAEGRSRATTLSRMAAVLILAGFAAGAALATQTAGVGLLWVAVVVGWAWLAAISIALYRTVPHPDADRRVAAKD